MHESPNSFSGLVVQRPSIKKAISGYITGVPLTLTNFYNIVSTWFTSYSVFFVQVLNVEVQALRRACTSAGLENRVVITFLVVQKRHHTRFFPTRREDEDGRNKNVPAGTIVDTVITHATELDFYLVSHASIQVCDMFQIIVFYFYFTSCTGICAECNE